MMHENWFHKVNQKTELKLWKKMKRKKNAEQQNRIVIKITQTLSIMISKNKDVISIIIFY